MATIHRTTKLTANRAKYNDFVQTGCKNVSLQRKNEFFCYIYKKKIVKKCNLL